MLLSILLTAVVAIGITSFFVLTDAKKTARIDNNEKVESMKSPPSSGFKRSCINEQTNIISENNDRSIEKSRNNR